MGKTKLLPCPFCGQSATLSTPESRDDGRYIGLDVECCGAECCATIEVGISWITSRKLTPDAIKADLHRQAIEAWNKRALPVKTFIACSEDEDVEDLETTDFEEAKDLLENLRDENPNQSWSLVADLDV